MAREGPYAAVTVCCQGMRRESGHWAGEGLGSGGWERGSLLATECHGCVRAFNGHRPHPASRKAGESQIAQWAYGALYRGLPYQVCSVSVDDVGLAHLARFAKIELIDGHLLSPGRCSGLLDLLLVGPSRGARQRFVLCQAVHPGPIQHPLLSHPRQ